MDSGKENYLGMVIAYDRPDEQVLAEKRVVLTQAAKPAKTGGDVRVGLIGAGEFARGTLLPAIRSHPHVRLVGVAEVTSKTGLLAGQRSGFEYCTCDYREILRDANIDAVFVATRHHVHAAQVCEALAAGKHVFVEKPLGLTLDELEKVRDALAASGGWLVLQVGHNRRFSAAADELRAFFRDRKSPMVLNYRVNAGPMPATHWTRGPEGGGRWLGEGSHFVDFAVAICGAVPDRLYATRIRTGRDSSVGETWNVTLTFPDSSTATISYCDLGNSGVPKERCEVFADGKIAILDDYTQLNLYERGSKRTVKLTDKGHPAEVAAFIDAVRGARPLPVSVDEELAVASITILCARSAETGEAVAFDLAAALADV
jgi:predicted dehydrogenase